MFYFVQFKSLHVYHSQFCTEYAMFLQVLSLGEWLLLITATHLGNFTRELFYTHVVAFISMLMFTCLFMQWSPEISETQKCCLLGRAGFEPISDNHSSADRMPAHKSIGPWRMILAVNLNSIASPHVMRSEHLSNLIPGSESPLALATYLLLRFDFNRALAQGRFWMGRRHVAFLWPVHSQLTAIIRLRTLLKFDLLQCLTHWGLVTLYGGRDLGQHCLR